METCSDDDRYRKGADYREGLRAIQEKLKVNLNGALEIALKDLQQGGLEHIEPTIRAAIELRREERGQ